MSGVIEKNAWSALRRFTPARIALGRAGHSLPTDEVLRFGLAHAQARDAVYLAFEPDKLRADLQRLGLSSILVHSAAPDRAQYLRRPDLGRCLAPVSRETLRAARTEAAPDLCLVIGDGLSACAVHRHALPVIELLLPVLATQDWRLAPVVVANQSRVALADDIAEQLGARIVAILIGERPGLSSPDSLGVYLTYAPRVGRVDSERNCISNIRPEGLGYADAARKLLFLLTGARRLKLSGVQLKDDSCATQLPPASSQ